MFSINIENSLNLTSRSGNQYVLEEPSYYVRISSVNENERFLYPVECGISICSPDYCISNHTRYPYLLMYIKQGTLFLNIPNHTYVLHAGDLFFVDTTRPYVYYNTSNENIHFVWIHIGGKDAEVYYNYLLEKSKTHVYHPDHAYVTEFIDFITRFCSHEINDPFLISSRIMHLLSQLNTSNDSPAYNLTAVIDYIQKNFSSKISLDELCKISNTSKSRFIHYFKETYGQTPYQYIINTRLSAAYRHLCYSNYSIEELAYSVGFNSPASFIDTFKKKYGISPGKMRSSYTSFDGLNMR